MHVVKSNVITTVKLGETWDKDMFQFLTLICTINIEENSYKEFSYSGHIASPSRS